MATSVKLNRIIPKSAILDSKSYIIKEINAPYFDPVFHLHPEFQLSYVTKGEGTRFVGDDIKQFTAGDLVFTGPNLPHVWRNHNVYFEKNSQLSTTVIVIYFQEHFLGGTVNEKEELESIKYLFQRSKRGLEITGATRNVVGKLMIDLLGMSGVASIIQLLKILEVLASSNECQFITNNQAVSLNIAAETHRMNKVYEFVMKNFSKKIGLEEVATIANMTRTSFSRYFRSLVNKSFSDFLKEIRIEYACKLLKEGKMNIDLIGYECGFQTPSNFNKQFKKVTGKQPNRYRNEYLKVTTDPARYA